MNERKFQTDHRTWTARVNLREKGWAVFIWNSRGQIVRGFTGIDVSLSEEEALDRAEELFKDTYNE